MSDALTTITKLINSPPGQLAAGGVLAGIVWKFFERVEAVLTDQTKLEIAVWLVGVKVGQKLEPWPDTFATVFDRVFGKKHLSWRCFLRSGLTSYTCFILVFLLLAGAGRAFFGFRRNWHMIVAPLFITVIPDYVSLLETRYLLRLMERFRHLSVWITMLFLDIAFTGLTGLIGIDLGPDFMGNAVPGSYQSHLRLELAHLFPTIRSFVRMAIIPFGSERSYRFSLLCFWLPSFFTSTWIWLYAGSGFLLKAARRFDIGFDWFNRKFDIEKKPLQSIGLVAGVVVALVYWTAVIVSRVIG